MYLFFFPLSLCPLSFLFPSSFAYDFCHLLLIWLVVLQEPLHQLFHLAMTVEWPCFFLSFFLSYVSPLTADLLF